MQNPTITGQKLNNASVRAQIGSEIGMSSFILSFAVPRLINSAAQLFNISKNITAIENASIYIACAVAVMGLGGLIVFSDVAAKLDAQNARFKSIMDARKQSTK